MLDFQQGHQQREQIGRDTLSAPLLIQALPRYVGDAVARHKGELLVHVAEAVDEELSGLEHWALHGQLVSYHARLVKRRANREDCEMTKYKAGDEVTLSAKITTPEAAGFEGMMAIRLKSWGPDSACVWIRVDDITTHTPKPRELKVGDVVGLEGAPECFRWVVMALHDDCVWLRGEKSHDYSCVRKTQIVRT